MLLSRVFPFTIKRGWRGSGLSFYREFTIKNIGLRKYNQKQRDSSSPSYFIRWILSMIVTAPPFPKKGNGSKKDFSSKSHLPGVILPLPENHPPLFFLPESGVELIGAYLISSPSAHSWVMNFRVHQIRDIGLLTMPISDFNSSSGRIIGDAPAETVIKRDTRSSYPILWNVITNLTNS